jgi:hypothetical protein
VSANEKANSPNYLLRRSQLTSPVMVKIGHFVAITVLFLSSALAFGQIQFVHFLFQQRKPLFNTVSINRQDVNGLEVRKPDNKNGILFEGAGHEDVDNLERRSPFIQALL